MASPSILAAASEFDSFKNYPPEKTGQLTVSGTISATPGSDYLNISTDIDLGRLNADFQVYMVSSLAPAKRFALSGGFAPLRNGTIPPSVSVPYNIFFTFLRSGTRLTCQVSITNPYGVTLTPVSETITFYVVPFIGSFV